MTKVSKLELGPRCVDGTCFETCSHHLFMFLYCGCSLSARDPAHRFTCCNLEIWNVPLDERNKVPPRQGSAVVCIVTNDDAVCLGIPHCSVLCSCERLSKENLMGSIVTSVGASKNRRTNDQIICGCYVQRYRNVVWVSLREGNTS